MQRSVRRRVEAISLASTLGGLPSSISTAIRTRSPASALRSGVEATRAIGVLLPPGRPGLVRGAVAHVVISVVMGELLIRTLPGRRPIQEGAAAGLVMGIVNVAVIGRRFDEIRALPLVPQLADNIAFGVIVTAVLSRRASPAG